MQAEKQLAEVISQAIKTLYGEQMDVALETTKPDFVGDFTFVVFPLLRYSKKNPEQTAEEIGKVVSENTELVSTYNVIKGFLNLVVSNKYFLDFTSQKYSVYPEPLQVENSNVMVEYSAPNTNKPLHVGHARNNILGYSVSQILQFAGNKVTMANLINDRGIHICKSMLAYQIHGNNESPESTSEKGDALVGRYYVKFETELKAATEPIIDLIINGNFEGIAQEQNQVAVKLYENFKNAEGDAKIKAKDAIKDWVRNNSQLMQDCRQMLLDWENGDANVMALWHTMNNWVYAGFEETYKRMGVRFDTYYYESNTYKLGKDIVEEGVQKGVFYRKEDGSVWVDLSNDGLDHKLILRADGTSVYITQDMGTADLKYQDFKIDKSIYVVGNEQEYHFKVLKLIMKKLGRTYADGIFHLSYGMVDLPDGKMKSREGNVVDSDELMQKMIDEAHARTSELGKTEGMPADEITMLNERIGMAALKMFLLKVDPKKRMLFNPKESIDLQGDTGPFVLYTYARIQSILRKSVDDLSTASVPAELLASEKDLIKSIALFNEVVLDAARTYNPSKVAQYSIELAKSFNKFYAQVPILKVEEKNVRIFRLQLCAMASRTIATSLRLLGISTVDRM